MNKLQEEKEAIAWSDQWNHQTQICFRHVYQSDPIDKRKIKVVLPNVHFHLMTKTFQQV